MTDQRSTYYCSTRDVSEIYRPSQYGPQMPLSATSGTSQPVGQRNRIYVANAHVITFTPGDYVLVWDINTPKGEEIQVQSVVMGATPYLETVSDLTGNYTVANTARVRRLTAFNSRATGQIIGGNDTPTTPSTEQVTSLINQSEAYIENMTRRAWRTKTITEETHDFPIRIFTTRDWLDGIPVKLNYRNIQAVKQGDGSYSLSTAAGDKLEVYQGGNWLDWLTAFTPGRSGRYWIDPNRGILYLRVYYKIFSRMAIRVTYRIGESTVPSDIRRATALLVAAQLSEAEDQIVGQPSGEEMNIVPVAEKAARWRREAEKILERYREVFNLL